MKLITIAIIIALALNSCNQSPKTQTEAPVTKPAVVQNKLDILDKENGFRGYKFGTHIDSFKNMVYKFETKSNIKYYVRTDDTLKIGDYPLEYIQYGFYKGIFCYGMIKTKGLTNSHGVLSVLNDRYGQAYKEEGIDEKYIWSGKTAVCMYLGESETNNATFVSYNDSLDHLIRKDRD